MSKVRAMLLAAAMAAGAAAPAFAVGNFQEFTIDETSIPGANVDGLANPMLTGDKFNGAFVEYVTFTSATQFSAKAFARFNELLADDGDPNSTVDSLIGASNLSGGYNIYALFSATGTYSGLNFTGSAAAFDLFVDPNRDSIFVGTNGLTAFTGTGTSDDYRVAFSTTLVGAAGGTLQSAPGAYNFNFGNFSLTDSSNSGQAGAGQNGQSFFVAPNPFHVVVQVNGDNDQATGALPTIRVTGDVSAVFPVPEPGALALVGLALAGAGLASRRGRK